MDNDDKIEETEVSEKSAKKGILASLRQVRFALATTIVLLSLMTISAVFVVRVWSKTETSCYEDLAMETEDAIDYLEANLRSDRTMLRVIAGLIGNADDIDSIEVGGYLANYDVNSLITQAGILLPGDELMSTKGRRSRVSSTLNFEHESLLGEHISSPQPSANNPNTQVIRSFVPIRKDGICIGLLYSAGSPSNIGKAWIPGIYDKRGHCYVVDRRTGEIIINTSSDGITDIHDIPFIQTDPSYTKDGTINSILAGRKGYSVYTSEDSGERSFMCYLPFSIEDWEMVALVPESAVFSGVAPVRNGMYLMIAASVVVVLIYGLWLLRAIRSSLAETEQKANMDVLTGLQNRNRFETYLEKLEGTKDRLVCIYVDANGLHELNNSKGHFAGDQMLRFIADTLKVYFDADHIYRVGGDEFIVLQKDMSDIEVKSHLMSFSDALDRNDYHAAIGTSTYSSDMTTDALIKTAETEMYKAKKRYYDQIGKPMRP